MKTNTSDLLAQGGWTRKDRRRLLRAQKNGRLKTKKNVGLVKRFAQEFLTRG